MFLVRDGIEARHAKIRTFMDTDDAAIAVLLAAADFERTVRRAILALGNTPTPDLRPRVQEAHGLGDLWRLWKSEVAPRHRKYIKRGDFFPWQPVDDALSVRHRIIHGSTRTLSIDDATQAAGKLLSASKAIHSFAENNEADLDARIVRRRPRPINSQSTPKVKNP